MLRSLLRPVLAAALIAGTLGTALAGASSQPTAYTPDPSLKTASRSELETRIRRACAVTQARAQNVAESALARSCGCYASRTLRAMDETELAAYRATGVFNDTARAKALTALDACRLQRPA